MAMGGRATKRRKLSNSAEEPKQVKNIKATYPTNDGDMESIQDQLPSIKDFASSDPTLRRQNLTDILSHLEARPATIPLRHVECLQLWRGLYVILYMHDSKNAVSVQKLIATLAGTITLLAEKDVERTQKTVGQTKTSNETSKDKVDESDNTSWLSTYTAAFWETMAREWSSIDSHRVNKYLLLIRLVVREIFKVSLSPLLTSQKNIPPETTMEEQLSVFEMWPLNGKERKISDGLRLHVLDVWNDELLTAMETVESEHNGQQATEAKRKTQKSKTKQKLGEQKREALEASKRPLDKISQSNSGAQRHVRQKAKELLAELDGKISDIQN